MGDVGFPVRANQIPVPENLHRLGHRAGYDQITPRGPGIKTLLVYTKSEEVGVEQESIPGRAVVVSRNDLVFKDQVGKTGLDGIGICGEPLLNLEDTGDDIKQGLRGQHNVRLAFLAVIDFSRSGRSSNNSQRDSFRGGGSSPHPGLSPVGRRQVSRGDVPVSHRGRGVDQGQKAGQGQSRIRSGSINIGRQEFGHSLLGTSNTLGN